MTKNGDDKHAHDRSAMDVAEERLAARHEAEAAEEADLLAGFTGSTEPPPMDGAGVEEHSPDTHDDPLSAWKRRIPGKPVTMDQIHQGLIAVCEYSEAAVEATIKIHQDVREVVQTVDDRTRQMAYLTAKVESTFVFANKIDEDLATTNATLAAMRKDVQFLKDDMKEVKEATLHLSAIKDMLAEIIMRLPDKPV